MLTQPAPKQLISFDGEPIYGHFDGIVQQLNIADFDYHTQMDKPHRRWAKYFHYKQFQFVCLTTPHYLIAIAIADIRYLSSAFCYIYDNHKQSLKEQRWLRPINWDSQTCLSPYQGLSQIAAGQLSFNIHQGKWQVKAHCKSFNLDIHLASQSDSLPLSLCTPTGYSGWTYTQKHNGLTVDGSLEVDGEIIDLSQALASYDFSGGYMRRETSWRWASLNTNIQGNIIGLNLAAGVNETGNNENALWINGQRQLLSPILFDFKRQQAQQAWHIHSTDGRIELNFTPLNQRSEKLNLWLLKSNFRQFIGHFDGFIVDEAGQKHTITQALGLTEDHYAKW